MTRRADPERIYTARRTAVFRILTASGKTDELEAEHRLASWEREAERQGLDRLADDYWQAAQRWIAERSWR